MAEHWTDADRKRVIQLIKDGYSRREIGAATGISRNAAAGRIFRDKQLNELSRAREEARAPKPKPQPKLKERRMSLKSVNRSAPPESPEKVLPVTRHVPKPEARRIPLFELKADECNWPVEADKTAIGGQLFCGAPTEEKRGWCPYHAFVGYAPSKRG